MKRVIATMALLIGLVTPAWADLNQGISAFRSGDYETAQRELTPAATGGDPQAQYYLGMVHNLRTGIAADPVQAVSWFRRAAEQGHGYGQFSLALMYFDGRGIQHSPADARLWFRRAYANGVLDARPYLGYHPRS